MPGVGFLLSLMGGGKILEFLGKVLDFLKSPVGIMLLIATFGFGCFTAGRWHEEKICSAEKQESISRAKEIDLGASVNADEGLQRSLDQARLMLLAAQAQLREQADETARLPAELRRARMPSDAEWQRLREPEGGVRRTGAKPRKRR